MSKTSRLLIALCLVVGTIVGASLALYYKVGTPGAIVIPEESLKQLRATSYPDVSNQMQALSQWQDRVLVLNFWATWCPPCRTEMPMFSQTQEELGALGVQFVGVGIDSPSAIKEFALRYPVSYPLLTGGTQGIDLMHALGNPSGGLPYTLVFDRNSQAVMSHLGLIDETTLKGVLMPLLSSGEKR